ncbi:bacillithiol system redox-active protein YtxJ [Penaeicola halotolerans]|uniref:bacillithiol system redox-active protein YtxJ n=1 Tax=Penaeicola halotolerans TaxID=2793196 RepID=UPI001CF7F72E|nr:bacillithiol system redox-active protein YtxJ [Penaeicola halotolerans]
MNWENLTNDSQLAQIIAESQEKPVLIFKHSTRCSISSMALDRLQRNWRNDYEAAIKPYYLDLISYRDISNLIAEKLHVPHESPQAILVKNGEVVYDASHMGINLSQILAQAKK